MGAGQGWTYVLDQVHRRLLRDGQPVPLGDRAFDLLRALGAADGQPVTAADLTAQVWPGVTVSAGNLRVQVRALRRALGDDAIENVPGVGYRLALALAAPASLEQPVVDRLVGRGAELERLRDMLSQSRLVSIVGPGGVGKTSLARAFAGGQSLRMIHVELAPVRQPGLVPVVTAAALSMKFVGGDLLAAVRTSLSAEPTLLVLDNAEHLLDEVAEFADGLLSACPDVRLLLTSREPLGLGGEMLLHLCPLMVSPEDETDPEEIRASPAVRLVLRNHARAGWRPLADTEMPALARLCRHLDGLPLGLVLLAGLLRDCTVEEVVQALEGRFQDLPLPDEAGYRHDSLTRMLDWSVETLSEHERLLLCRLSVFSGVWTVEQAVAVCGIAPLRPGDVPGLVAGLVSRSLVAGPGQRREPGLRLLDTIRQYALALEPGLIDRDRLRSRVIDWLENETYRFLRIKGRVSAANEPLRLDVADVRSMLVWALGCEDVLRGQELAIISCRLWNYVGPMNDLVDYVLRAWDLCSDHTPPHIRATLGLLIHGEGLPIRLQQHAHRDIYARTELAAALEAIRAPDVPHIMRVDGLMSGGYIHWYTGDAEACLALWAEAVAFAGQHGMHPDQVKLLSLAGWLRAEIGDADGARREFTQALSIAEQQGLFLKLPLLRLADAEFSVGHQEDAIATARRALSLNEPTIPVLQQTLLANLSSYLLLCGQTDVALVHAQAALIITRRVQYSFVYPWTLERGALLAVRMGQIELGQKLAALGDALVQSGTRRRSGPERALHVQLTNELRPNAETQPSTEWPVEDALEALSAFYAAHLSSPSNRP
jgi:predicted ATPase